MRNWQKRLLVKPHKNLYTNFNMPRKSDEERKRLFEDIGTLFDARAKTLEININAHTDFVVRASEERTNAKIKALEANMATKDDIKNMATKDDIKKLEERMATKSDIVRLEKKFDDTKDLRKQVDELKKRLDQVEAELQRVRARN